MGGIFTTFVGDGYYIYGKLLHLWDGVTTLWKLLHLWEVLNLSALQGNVQGEIRDRFKLISKERANIFIQKNGKYDVG